MERTRTTSELSKSVVGEELEKWTLKHAWIKEVTFGDLDYGSEDLTEVTIKFRYDWATF